MACPGLLKCLRKRLPGDCPNQRRTKCPDWGRNVQSARGKEAGLRTRFEDDAADGADGEGDAG